MSFEKLDLLPEIQKALKTEGYEKPTPIQAQSIPLILQRKDIFGIAQTGTGKTAAFALPILHILRKLGHDPMAKRPIKALIITPTRELAIQIGESFAAYGKHTNLRHVVIFGGVGQNPQTRALTQGVDILIATPGRLLDLMDQRYVALGNLEILVLDEADRMLDMGFINDIRKIIAKLPSNRQTLLFSATMPPQIMQLAHTILKNPVKVEVTPPATTVDKIKQAVYFVEKGEKLSLLEHVLEDRNIWTALVFTRTKHGADRVAKHLSKQGIETLAIHGNKSQNARQRALEAFKKGKIRVLVATDIAARGIDVEDLSHVINFDIPHEPESYVHRIGRTGRAGAEGIALSFCASDERADLRLIQRLIGKEIAIKRDHPFHSEGHEVAAPAPNRQRARFDAHRGRTGGRPSDGRSSSAGRSDTRNSFPSGRQDTRSASSSGRSEGRTDERGRSAPKPNAGNQAAKRYSRPSSGGNSAGNSQRTSWGRG